MGNAIKKIFFGMDELRMEPWASLWKERLIQYLFILIVVCIFGIFLIRMFNLAPTNHENALYFLSAIVQTQAAIISLVITLTIIAIQMAAASYTPRVVDVMKKNPDMWFLLIIYFVAITYGLIVLKLLALDPDPSLVTSVLILGIFTFCSLFLYMKNTIAMLRPDEVVKMLVGEINTENICKTDSKNDIMQPVFDVVHASIMRYDVTTTRTGLNALSDRITELFSTFDESAKTDIVQHFCDHIQRSALIALKNDDLGIFKEVIADLQKFGVECCNFNDSENVVESLSQTLRFIGTRATDKGLGGATELVADALQDIGIHAADHELKDAPVMVVYYLGMVGKHAADNRQEYSTIRVIEDLLNLGIYVIDCGKGMEYNTTRQVAISLGTVGRPAADKGLKDAIYKVTSNLAHLGIYATGKGDELRETVISVVGSLWYIGYEKSGRDDAAYFLAYLLFYRKDIISESIKKTESNLDPCDKQRFSDFMTEVDRKLKNGDFFYPQPWEYHPKSINETTLK
ncbi:MAG: DUF2254 domain-containing protein [Deltaproteobacteria bacterium]|nr:DUF2254 domain-containing protein [Deltaproteobacteria bacterium]